MSDCRRLFAFALMVLLRSALVASAGSRPPLTYRFEPGDWLVYEVRSEKTLLATGQAAEHCFIQVEVWCLAAENEQTLLLLDSIRLVDNHPEPMRGIVLRIDARGRADMSAATKEEAVEMESAFDVLPVQASPLEDRGCWTTPTDLFGCRRCCRGHDRADQQPGTTSVDFEVAFPPGDGEALGHSRRGKYCFDVEGGYVRQFESTEIDRSAGLRTESAGILRARTRKPDGWAERRAAEAEQYLLALRREGSLLRQVQDHPESAEQALRGLERLWAVLGTGPARQTDSPFQILARAQRQRWSAEADVVRRMAAYAQSWLGRTAAPWNLVDAHGQTVSSETARRGACVELLWSTDAPHSFAMLAELKSAHDEPACTEIPVICLNLDRDSTAGRRSIAQLPPGLTHILAGPIRAVEQPVRLPIMRVLDREGRIVRVWIGWQPSCAEALAEARRRGQ